MLTRVKVLQLECGTSQIFNRRVYQEKMLICTRLLKQIRKVPGRFKKISQINVETKLNYMRMKTLKEDSRMFVSLIVLIKNQKYHAKN